MDETAKEGRGGLLTFFTFVANVYLAAFAADALVSVLDELVRAGAGVGDTPLSTLRNVVAWATIAGSLLMIFVVTFVPQLPKLIFVPMIAAVLWFALGAPPFAQDARETQLFLATCQLGLAALAFLIVQMTHGSLFLKPESLPRKNYLFLRIVAASIVTLTLVPVALVAFGVAAVVTYAETETKGYLQFTWSEIRVRESIMVKRTKTVHLVATAHIAEGDFYRTLYRNIPVNAVVLAEGISDRKQLLGPVVSAQDNAANGLGLETQDVFESLLGPAVVEPADGAPSPTPAAGTPPAPKTRPDVVRADVDISELSETTIRCLREDFKMAQSSIEELMQEDPANSLCTPEDRARYYNEILYKRNQKVLSEFDKRIDKYDVFVVPWGALHMPDLERGFLERGFKIERVRMLTLARYQTIAGQFFNGVAAYRMRGAANRPYRVR